uniref:Peptidase S1 domain-containing protein n=1 Tax=Panagrolaimus sp. PS1159 TaxID=55785 RepID=A0AC35FKU4_9BILA
MHKYFLRVENGVITPPGMFPFTIKIFCTATIISKRHLLCASHCYRDESLQAWNNRTDTYMYFLKDGNPNDDHLPWGGKFMLYFPLNSSSTHFHDIVVLEYPEGTNFTEIAEPVKLAKDYIEKEGDEAYIAGFG